MQFKQWLQLEVENDFSYWKNILLGYLNLDQKNGLSQPIDTMNRNNLKNKLQGLGEFAKLPSSTQQQVLTYIDTQPSGTMGDLIRLIAGELRV